MFSLLTVSKAVITTQGHLIGGVEHRVGCVMLDEAIEKEHEFGNAFVTPLWDFTQEKVLHYANEMERSIQKAEIKTGKRVRREVL